MTLAVSGRAHIPAASRSCLLKSLWSRHAAEGIHAFAQNWHCCPGEMPSFREYNPSAPNLNHLPKSLAPRFLNSLNMPESETPEPQTYHLTGLDPGKCQARHPLASLRLRVSTSGWSLHRNWVEDSGSLGMQFSGHARSI